MDKIDRRPAETVYNVVSRKQLTNTPWSKPVMPRSRSPDSQRRSESSNRHLPGSAEPISDSDYFLKSAEFRVWLKEEKHKVAARVVEWCSVHA